MRKKETEERCLTMTLKDLNTHHDSDITQIDLRTFKKPIIRFISS
jgi:hypothetical protein